MAVNNYMKWPAERIRQDENNRLVSDLQITTWNGKADADHNHNDKYIPLSGTVALTGAIYPAEGKTGIAIGNPAKLFEMMAAKVFYAGGSSPKVQISGISDNGYIAINGKNRSGEDIGCQIQPSPDSSSNSICYLPVKSGTFALTKDIPESLKNPNALSIQLNGGDATEYDGSAAKSIDITPASIGALAVSDVKDWAKADTKPIYTFAEITEKPDTYTPSAHTHKDADIESISASKITGTISIKNLPKAALERCVPVTNDEARFALTTDTVQLGDTVKVEDTGLMYLVVDESKLNSEDGYQPYTAAAAASVPWTGVTGKPEKFTPDTHTHAISEVTGLQDALDGKAAKDHVHDSEKVVNWNNVVVSGAYYAAADASNNPSADAAYSGNVVKGATIVTQTVVKETVSGDLYKYIRRGQMNDERTAVTTWGEWQEIQYVVTGE